MSCAGYFVVITNNRPPACFEVRFLMNLSYSELSEQVFVQGATIVVLGR